MPQIKFLITGATGGLGSGIVTYFLSHNIPTNSFAVSSSRASNAELFAKKGLQFRHAAYSDVTSLQKSFEGVENLFFVSGMAYDTNERVKEHKNVINAAVKTGVTHIWYTSLAWGGYGNESKIDVQQAHLQTEVLLKKSGIKYTIIREGIYADAFPILINYYPSSQEIFLPSDGNIAFASRAELAEANAKMLLDGGFENETVLLTGPRTCTLTDVVDTINGATGREIQIKRVDLRDYVRLNAANDIGGKPAAFFEKKVSWFEGVEKGDGATVDEALEKILGRKPLNGIEVVEKLLEENREYDWKQNHFK